jgi:hypothetical protein
LGIKARVIELLRSWNAFPRFRFLIRSS